MSRHIQTLKRLHMFWKYFTTLQARTIEALSEVIIPADDHSPAGAAAAKVYECIDEIVFSSPDDVKKLWTEGLAGMDLLAIGEFGQEYAKCSTAQQVELMERISRNEEQPATPEEKFFVVLKTATIDGYYTSSIGIHQDLEYQGNTMVLEFPGCACTRNTPMDKPLGIRRVRDRLLEPPEVC